MSFDMMRELGFSSLAKSERCTRAIVARIGELTREESLFHLRRLRAGCCSTQVRSANRHQTN